MGGVGTHAESVISGERPKPGVAGQLQAGQHFQGKHMLGRNMLVSQGSDLKVGKEVRKEPDRRSSSWVKVW